jgi:hypothetical protein
LLDVNQGYRNNYTPPAATDAVPPSSGRAIFRSASETIRDVYGGQSATTSNISVGPVRKRALSFSNKSPFEDDINGDGDTPMVTTNATTPTTPSSTETVSSDEPRAIKPLRRQRQPFGKSVSLPAGSSLLPPTFKPAAMPTSTESVTEEDWSEGLSSSTITPASL